MSEFDLSTLRVRDPSGWTMFVFGILALIIGIISLLSPEIMLILMNFNVMERDQRHADDYTVLFVNISAVASFVMGVYYVLAALTNTKIFYYWTLPFRTFSFIVFTTLVFVGTAPVGFLGIGLWELMGAVATGYALHYERKQKKT